jgi:phosphoglycerate dehydrogenase-like enzyme
VDLLVCDPALDAVDGLAVVSLSELLARADVVSLHVPLRESTRHLISATELAHLGPRGVLVNTSRGGLVDERALTEALAAGRLRAAALDVFADEPTVPSGLAELSNVVLTPHIGGLSDRSIAEMTEKATASVIAVLNGHPDPATVANPDVLEVLAR